jgi:hypothetical protein
MIRELSVMFLKYKILKIRIMSLKENQFNKIDKKKMSKRASVKLGLVFMLPFKVNFKKKIIKDKLKLNLLSAFY